jgi:putative flippase GtrA
MERGYRSFKQLSRYSLSAVLSAALDWITFIFLNEMTSHILFAQGSARLMGGSVSFIFNKKYSFKSVRKPLTQEITKFLILYFISYVLSLVLISFGAKLFPEYIYIVKLSTDSTLFIFNFLIMKFFVFSDTIGATSEE